MLLLISLFFKAVRIEIIKEAPWQVLWFSIGLYVVVFGLKNAGLTNDLHLLIKHLNILETGFLSGILSSVLNNLPAVMLMDIALKGVENHSLIYANIIGVNIGSKLTPIGSLSTLIWLHIMKKGRIEITYWKYIKYAFIITPMVLFLVLMVV